MTHPTLFPDLPEPLPVPNLPPVSPREVRVVRPVRNQAEMMIRDLDSNLPQDHPARSIWSLIEKLDLSAFYTSIQAVSDGPGRSATDPKVLLALWVYATIEGIGSARHLARLSEEHDVYRWLRGNVPINYHLLADFRVSHQKAMDDLLTQVVAVLLKAKVVQLKRVAQDGMRVRASGGASSFRREPSLRQCLEKARDQVERVTREREHPDPKVSRREQSARERAVRERQERVEEALRYLPMVQAAKKRQAKHAGKARAAKLQEPRVSTSDPSARVMKMPDGGFRPAYNVQLATDTESQVIVGVKVTNQGTDQGEAKGVEEQVAQRTGKHPEAYLMDGGFVDLKDIEAFEHKGITVYAPPKVSKEHELKNKRYQRKTLESPGVVAWRERMGTEEAKEIYKERAAVAECVNALMRSRYGLLRFTVRGLPKVSCVTLLAVLTHNLWRWMSLNN
jgi:transposase